MPREQDPATTACVNKGSDVRERERESVCVCVCVFSLLRYRSDRNDNVRFPPTPVLDPATPTSHHVVTRASARASRLPCCVWGGWRVRDPSYALVDGPDGRAVRMPCGYGALHQGGRKLQHAGTLRSFGSIPLCALRLRWGRPLPRMSLVFDRALCGDSQHGRAPPSASLLV